MIVVGVDAHKASHTLVAVDHRGRKLGGKTVAATSEGSTLTVPEVQKILRLPTTDAVYRRLNDGIIPGIRIGKFWRIPRREFEAFLAGQTAAQEQARLDAHVDAVVAGWPGHSIGLVSWHVDELVAVPGPHPLVFVADQSAVRPLGAAGAGGCRYP